MFFGPTKKSETRDSENAATMVEVAESLADASFRKRFFSLFFSLNAAIWLAAVFLADYVHSAVSTVMKTSDKAGMTLIIVPAVLAFFAAYAFLRMKFTDVEENKQLDSDIMASFKYQADSTRRWMVWVGAAAAGVLNALALVVVNSYLADRF